MALSVEKRKEMMAAGTGGLDGRVFSRAEPRHKQVHPQMVKQHAFTLLQSAQPALHQPWQQRQPAPTLQIASKATSKLSNARLVLCCARQSHHQNCSA